MLAACSLLSVKQKQSMPLLPPLLSADEPVKKQKVTMLANDKSQTFIVMSHHQPQHYKALILTPTGQTLLSMTYDGISFEEDNKMGIKLPAQEIMAVMQFAAWPPSAVNNTYKEKEGWQVLIQPKLRRLSRNQNPILEVRYASDGEQSTGVIDIEHIQQDYRVHIQPLEAAKP